MQTTAPQIAADRYTSDNVKSLLGKLRAKVNKLLSDGSTNAKTVKNDLKTFILYLAPADQNSKGVNICPAADTCKAPCLFTAGHGAFNSVQAARIARTEYYINHRDEFARTLVNELSKLYTKALNTGAKFAIRLNGTSDLDFIAILKNRTGTDILETFGTSVDSDRPGLVFYDYTKLIGKVRKYAGTNYTLTFSYQPGNLDQCSEALSLGANVAAVFRDQLPAVWAASPVIDGDSSDIEMLSNKAKILGLKAKGQARKDRSGFVIDPS
jgi:hypothetical protein